DNGEAAYDALGHLLDLHDTGSDDEGLPTPGDSGGPAFIDGKVAGIASYTGIYTDQDYDAVPYNSSIGELGFWQRVSYYQQWIDQELRESYEGAPTQRSEVKQSVTEGDDGSTYAWFMLEFTGERADPDEWLSVDYATRDGSATAGEDYIPASGRLVLYPGENQAVIPVEVIGDRIPEGDEFFSLAVFNPVGGGFGAGVLELVSVRTIVDDDALLWEA
ncbi:MAG: sodium:calcium exchanger, partial [Candidatus Omnitrophica bacterium]|nr:sodium:calcium exchanger [Candidatus Omnitrophota bacterium]